MTAQTLRSVTLATIENYHTAATQATRAYRLGGKRLIGALNASLEKNVDPRTGKVAPQLTDTMLKVRGRVSEIAVKGIDEVSARTEKAVDVGYGGVARQVTKVAQFAAAIENPMIASTLQTAARVSLPTAKVALAVSGKVAEGAKALSTAARGTPVKTATRKAATAVKRRSTRVKARATATTRKTVKAVRTASAQPKKATVRATRKQA